MTKRRRFERDPEDEGRRQVIKGGLLAVATGLGFLPACSDAKDGSPPGSPGGSAGSDQPAGAGSSGQPAAPGSGGGAATTPASSAGRGGSSGMASAGRPSAGASATAGSSGQPGMLAGAGGTPMQAGTMTLPRAVLGKTGVSIPIIGLGTSRLGERGGTPNATDYSNMLKVFEQVMDRGVEYIDTGANYGRAEEALGELVPSRRDKIFLVTKLYTDSRSEAQRLFERSLMRMKTDHVDVLHLHSAGERNIDTVLSQDGAWSYILEQKAMGRARFVGITGHSNPPNFMRMLATNQVDVLMTIMNFVDHSTYGFSKTVRETAVAQGVGVMAMKVFGGTESVLKPGQGLANTAAPVPHKSNLELSFDVNVLPDSMRFVKTLGGVTGMVIGINFIEELERNIQWAIETKPFSDAEMQAVVKMGEMVAPMYAQRYG